MQVEGSVVIVTGGVVVRDAHRGAAPRCGVAGRRVVGLLLHGLHRVPARAGRPRGPRRGQHQAGREPRRGKHGTQFIEVRRVAATTSAKRSNATPAASGTKPSSTVVSLSWSRGTQRCSSARRRRRVTSSSRSTRSRARRAAAWSRAATTACRCADAASASAAVCARLPRGGARPATTWASVG